jgi:O-antigen ligase
MGMSVKPASSRAFAIAAALLALAAPFLGGSDDRWSQALILMGLGVLLIFHPPKKSNGWLFGLTMAFLLGWGLLAFTPATWWGLPPWRTVLQNDLGINPGTLLTAQPWLTFEAWWLLLAGCLWFYLLAAADFDSRQRRTALRTYAIGIIIMASISLLFYFEGWKIPFWNSSQNLGPFVNRNQMGNLLALGGMALLACAFHDGKFQKRWLFAWCIGLTVILAALIINYSRAGLLIFFAGACLWSLWIMIYSHSQTRIVLVICTILILLAVFFLFGGKSLRRLQLTADDSGGESIRWLVQADTFQMTRQMPLTGCGLDNFSSVFALYRQKSVSQSRAVHPESDWLWMAAEMGWPAVFILVTGLGLLWTRWKHLAQHSDRASRTACLICGLLFAIHGLVDVSGHRLGTLWPALFLLSLSLG